MRDIDDLHNYQLSAAARMGAQRKGLNASGMGTGKTVSTLTMLEQTRWLEDAPTGIVAPKRVAAGTWQREASRWKHLAHLPAQMRHIDFGDLQLMSEWYKPSREGLPAEAPDPKPTTRLVFEDVKRTREHLLRLARQYPYCTFSYDALPWITAALEHRWPWKRTVLDESTFVKSYKSLRFQSMKHVRELIDRLWLLAGRPRPNGLEDLWAQAYLIDGGEALGKNITAFRAQFMADGARNQQGQVVGYKPRPFAEAQVTKLMEPLMFSLIARDWLELPEEVINPVVVKLPQQAREIYDEVERNGLIRLGQSLVEDTAAGIKLLQMANGRVYGTSTDAERCVHHLHDEKLDAVEELAEATGNVLLAFPFKPDKAALVKRFGKRLATMDNPAQVQAWTKGQRQILAMHPAEGAHGLDGMQDVASTVVWYGPTPNLEHYLQMNARIVRQGQQAGRVVIHHLIAEDTIDEDQFDLLASKEESENLLLQAMRLRVDRQRAAA